MNRNMFGRIKLVLYKVQWFNKRLKSLWINGFTANQLKFVFKLIFSLRQHNILRTDGDCSSLSLVWLVSPVFHLHLNRPHVYTHFLYSMFKMMLEPIKMDLTGRGFKLYFNNPLPKISLHGFYFVSFAVQLFTIFCWPGRYPPPYNLTDFERICVDSEIQR